MKTTKYYVVENGVYSFITKTEPNWVWYPSYSTYTKAKKYLVGQAQERLNDAQKMVTCMKALTKKDVQG